MQATKGNQQKGKQVTSDESGFLPYDPADLDRVNADPDLLDLLKQVDRDIVGWNPQNSGEQKVYGKVVDITDATSDFQKSPENPDGEYPLVVIETPSGNLVGVHAFHQVLRNEIARQIRKERLVIGAQIAIAYRGEGSATSGKNAPQMYRVAVLPPKS